MVELAVIAPERVDEVVTVSAPGVTNGFDTVRVMPPEVTGPTPPLTKTDVDVPVTEEIARLEAGVHVGASEPFRARI